jgi:L-aspartate oxidase
VVVVGSGVAGLTTALTACRRLPEAKVVLVTKSLLEAGSTRWAQGGIAAALDPDDSPADHLRDTLTAGAGLCNAGAVRTLVTEGPAAVRGLMALGARFDTGPGGELALGREGGHLRRRIAHAGGDATGAEISRALLAALKAAGNCETIEHALVLDLLRTRDGRAAGLTLHVMGEGQHDGVGAVEARAVVLATGGLGQVYAATTNPEVSTGDGLALALRAGAEAADLEFVQFHPTVLWLGAGVRGRQPLISEAVRGEGAVLLDGKGRRFMAARHPLADLAPRDVVAKEITRVMAREGTDHVYLDGRHLGEAVWEHRFPTIADSCRRRGIEPVTDLIPVVPAAHYASGGVRTDLWGRTSVPGLYACGEVACTGVHGANRLASNSLLEGLVFAARIGADLAGHLPEAADPVPDDRPAALLDPAVRPRLQEIMSQRAGVLRSGEGLRLAAKGLAILAGKMSDRPGTDAWEASNLHMVASGLVAAAAARQETRGSHWREDYPDTDDEWLGHLVVTAAGEGPAVRFERQAGSPGTDPAHPAAGRPHPTPLRPRSPRSD